MNERLIEKLKDLARGECFYDDPDPDVIVDDYAGGNIDDAFACGERAGEIVLARDILSTLGIAWNE
jgi:hypothetical protein